MIRVGLVGFGLAGSVFHAPLIGACERMELSGILTSRDVPARVDRIEELLDCSELVVIATPNSTHFDIAAAALDAGKHVIVDKPFTVTLPEADELIAKVRDSGQILTVFHNRRWDSDFMTARKILPSLGEIHLFEAHWDRFRPAIKKGWREIPQPGGGLFNDLGPHMIDQALTLFGLPDAVCGDVQRQRPAALADDYFDVTLLYGARRVTLRSSSLITAPRPRFALYGMSGSFLRYGLDPQEGQLKAGIDPRSQSFGVDKHDGLITLVDGTARSVRSERGNYLAFYEGVADAILNGAKVPVAPLDARTGLMLIDLARRSAELGQRLPVPDANLTES